MVGPNLPFGGLACGLVLGPLPSVEVAHEDVPVNRTEQLTNIHALDVVNRVILKLNVPTKRGNASRSMRRKENQEELIMMTHQVPLQVMKKKQIYV